MKIKVIASRPRNGQQPIEELIGKEYAGKYDREDKTYTVQAGEPFNGQVVLHKDEVERVKEAKH